MAGDCSGRGCTYVWWGNPGMRIFTVITFIMFILGIILTGVGYSQQTCPNGFSETVCTDTQGTAYDCTGPSGSGLCADKSCPSDSVCSAGDTLLSIASFIIFIQLCRLCCCATPYYVGGPTPMAQQPVIMATVVTPGGQVMSPQAVPYGQPMYAAGYQPYGGQAYAYPAGGAPQMGQPMGQQMGQQMGQPMGAQPMQMQMGMGAPTATYAYVQQGGKPEPPMAGQPQPYQYPGQGYTMEGAPQQQPAPTYVGQPTPYGGGTTM